MRPPARVDARSPHRLTGIDVPDSGNFTLIQQKEFQGPAACCKKPHEFFGVEFGREWLNAKGADSGNRFRRLDPLHAPEMPAVNETECSAIRFQGYVNVAEGLARIEPNQLAVQSKMKDQRTVLQLEDEILPAALNGPNFPSARVSLKLSGCLFGSPAR